MHGHDVMQQVGSLPGVLPVLERVKEFAEKIRRGQYTGWSGKPIRNIINIGIGGSDLGPAMAYEALRPYANRDLTFRFVSNVDGGHLSEALNGLDPAETLFIVASKTFTTLETLTNAQSARQWLMASLTQLSEDARQDALHRHFVRCLGQSAGSGQIRPRPATEFVSVLGMGRREIQRLVCYRSTPGNRHRAGAISEFPPRSLGAGSTFPDPALPARICP